MLTIDGLVMAGLAPPGASAPATQGAGAGADFAALLAVASQATVVAATPVLSRAVGARPIALTEPLIETPRIAVDDPGVGASTPAPSPVEPIPLGLSGLPPGDAGAPPGATAPDRPDRSSEAEQGSAETEIQPSLPAAALAMLPSPAMAAPPEAPGVTARGDRTASAPTVTAATSPDVPRSLEVAGDDAARAFAALDTAGGLAAESTIEAEAPADVPPLTEALRAPAQSSEPPARGGQPGEHPGAPLRGQPPAERSEIATAWNRAGSGPGEAPDASLAPVPSTEAAARDNGLGPTVQELAARQRDDAGAASRPATTGISATPGKDVAPALLETGPLVESAAASASDQEPGADPDSRAAELRVDASPTAIHATPAATGGPERVALEARISAPSGGGAAVEAREPGGLQARLADSVVEATRTGDAGIRLVLSPPELGHLEIRVERGDTGMRVEVVTTTADAADLVQQQLPALVSGLEARSLRVDFAEVRHAPTGGATGLSTGGDARQPGEGRPDGQPQWQRPDWSAAARLGAESTTSNGPGRPGDRLLDLVA